MLKKATYFIVCSLIGTWFTLGWGEAAVPAQFDDVRFNEQTTNKLEIEQHEGLSFYPVSQSQKKIQSTVPRRWMQQRGELWRNTAKHFVFPDYYSHGEISFNIDYSAHVLSGPIIYLYRYMVF